MVVEPSRSAEETSSMRTLNPLMKRQASKPSLIAVRAAVISEKVGGGQVPVHRRAAHVGLPLPVYPSALLARSRSLRTVLFRGLLPRQLITDWGIVLVTTLLATKVV